MKRILSLPDKRSLVLGEKPLVMGIVNLTPDSFFPGSRAPEPEQAVDRALALLAEGADILDFGAESTRPGSAPVGPDEEMGRLIPALRAFRARSGALVSVDTRRAAVAKAALDEGADIVNDIAALSDPAMASVVARFGAGIVLMHMLGEPSTMQENPVYSDCAAEVAAYLRAAVSKALDAGIARDSIILDPGIGFGKTLEHNLDLIRRLYLVAECGYPVLVGLSRKRFIGQITGKPVEQRLSGSLGAACAAWMGGADIIRVHDVAETKDALALFVSCLPTRAYPGRAVRT
ncbi:MAG: dihydropteroate synthase [Spirochaetia bacterium]|jgi:dihydropteroate synthase|nr:dihydropteroate synthase [Spirochaetia bacterium]